MSSSLGVVLNGLEVWECILFFLFDIFLCSSWSSRCQNLLTSCAVGPSDNKSSWGLLMSVCLCAQNPDPCWLQRQFLCVVWSLGKASQSLFASLIAPEWLGFAGFILPVPTVFEDVSWMTVGHCKQTISSSGSYRGLLNDFRMLRAGFQFFGSPWGFSSDCGSLSADIQSPRTSEFVPRCVWVTEWHCQYPQSLPRFPRWLRLIIPSGLT